MRLHVAVMSMSEYQAACAGKDGWSDPAPPLHVFGNTYDVGTCGITVLLITSPKGHVLLDAGPAEAAPLVAANIERLGFRLGDVKLIGTSHEHAEVQELLAKARQELEGSFRQFLAAENMVFRHAGRVFDDLDAARLAEHVNDAVAESVGEPPVPKDPALT